VGAFSKLCCTTAGDHTARWAKLLLPEGEVDLSLQGLASMEGERIGRDDIRIIVKSSLLYRLAGIGSDDDSDSSAPNIANASADNVSAHAAR
jgi:hypothetical protein